ncbi:hypothetical protein M378DRAFT_173694 [Amanita muscaria Koide BX008]|uniref:Uncharacterized protein n=1 Tax=Amanita muscaria (strain Koide BX008) TaxID=946122 RepID=A0A0C2W2K7_AMAMK|nr:hypothetical protein M378DRAFT_173694 [Amanita muscaria Koide BX008]
MCRVNWYGQAQSYEMNLSPFSPTSSDLRGVHVPTRVKGVILFSGLILALGLGRSDTSANWGSGTGTDVKLLPDSIPFTLRVHTPLHVLAVNFLGKTTLSKCIPRG